MSDTTHTETLALELQVYDLEAALAYYGLDFAERVKDCGTRVMNVDLDDVAFVLSEILQSSDAS
ncbi:hypothetical protein [Sulfitobacter aestuariivivens]|uniref:Uncharacterized protein n=1 Tax=Sulfitobacter aestuariivivens TaxID=2766981 RepID=A0A927D8S6_9RHOB|nr:hypothetical protein [Sulfitobacter aestuariivivens]MBD3665849.1 hypothetical protein [Sulfitobacter aestuariivivens]